MMERDEIEYEVMDVEDVRFLKQRIRELEKELYRTDHALHTADAYGHTLEERIAKAREILNATSIYRPPYVEYSYVLESEIKAVLQALEGK